jgi:hypothetical protein
VDYASITGIFQDQRSVCPVPYRIVARWAAAGDRRNPSRETNDPRISRDGNGFLSLLKGTDMVAGAACSGNNGFEKRIRARVVPKGPDKDSA